MASVQAHGKKFFKIQGERILLEYRPCREWNTG